MFRHPVIGIQPSNRIGSTWLSTAHCVWDGPQWLKSKQCLKLAAYLELEHLFRVSLKLPDACQEDVFNDLLMLKSQCPEENALNHRDTGYTQKRVGTAAPPYQPASVEEDLITPSSQSITSTEAYQKQSVEELRLQDCGKGWNPLVNNPKAFAGLEDDKIVKEVEKRYDYLWQKYSHPINGENAESRGTLRFTFEGSALVYIPKKKAWRPPSQCVWVDSSVQIPGMASIADIYPSRKTFFTAVLKTSEPTVDMYVDSLKAEAQGRASATQIIETMALICRLGIGKTDLSGLVEDKVLPLKLANGASRFAAASSKEESVDFAIVENVIHGKAFKGKIAVLDFSLEEIRDTRPLLLALGLENRFSSKLVKEITDVRGGSLDHEMTRNLRSKSQAIARCAFHFASLNKRQDMASLYRKFKRATVYVSDDIRRSLQIMQGGRSIEGASSRANLHLEEAEGALRLYLPKDEVERDVCFESDLPRRLCIFLNVTDPGAPGIIGAVFRKDKLIVIEKILENAGVGQVHCDFIALDDELGTSKAGSDIETLVEAASNVRLPAPSSVPRQCTPSGWVRRKEGRSGSEDAEDGRHKMIPDFSYQEQHKEAEETAYERILNQIVKVARQRVRSGVFESTELSVGDPVAIKALSQETIREAFATGSQDRDLFKIGAAGELYMFEHLKGLRLPGFGLENWKSAIRDRVKLHADYINTEKNNDRRALADIEYVDESRTFTQFLIQRGHLAQTLSKSDKPLYHIEIKTTPGSDWQEPFFMSKAQERHIQDKRIEDGKSCSNIYIICRIFNLGQGDRTGMHIYLDPETKRRNGELAFSTHTWAVKPLKHSSMLTGNDIARLSAAQTTRAAAENGWTSRDIRTNAGEQEAKVPSLQGSIFGSNSATSENKANTQTPSNRSNSGKRTNPSSSMAGNFNFFGPSRISPKSDTSKAPFVGLFGSNAESSNGDGSEAKPEGLFGSQSCSANNRIPKARSTGNIHGGVASNDASRNLFSSSTGFSGFGSSSSSTSKAPPAGSLFGRGAVSTSNEEILKTKPSSSIFGTAESSSSFSFSTLGGQSGIHPWSGNAQVSKTTAKGFSFGAAAKSTDSGPARNTPLFPELGAFSKSGFGTNATTSTSRAPVFGAAPTSTDSEPPQNTFDSLGSGTAFGLFGNLQRTSEAASTSQPTTSPTATGQGASDDERSVYDSLSDDET
ncbi:MAG: hypothetical protein Q9184_000918 [Pyrenodesmia sp. 2 TL-2023]